jgi:hypothetical protein
VNVKPAVPIEDVVRGEHFEAVVATLPQLTTQTTWAELRNLPIGNGSITMRHYGERRTVLINRGKTDLKWEAAFPGSFPALKVNGKLIESHTGSGYLGHAVTSVRVQVKAGKSASVEVPN